MKQHLWRYPISVLLTAALMIMLSSEASASITRRFNESGNLVLGNLVSISDSDPNTVVAATFSNVAALYGVVTQVGSGTVQVADTEVATTLVSISNGNISIGDPITVSGLQGVGQKATTSTRIVGYAQADFTAKTKGATSQDFKDKSGKSHKIVYGSIPVLLGVGSYLAPAPPPGSENTGVPPVIQNFFNSLAGHQVDSTRVVLSLFLMIVVVVVVGVLVSTSVRRSLTAIGRNPLARRSVLRGLSQVVVVALALVAAAMGGVYFIATH
jgi:hypothetical protein